MLNFQKAAWARMLLVIRKVLLLSLPLQKKIRPHQENEAGRDPKSRHTSDWDRWSRKSWHCRGGQTGSEKFCMRLARKIYPQDLREGAGLQAQVRYFGLIQSQSQKEEHFWRTGILHGPLSSLFAPAHFDQWFLPVISFMAITSGLVSRHNGDLCMPSTVGMGNESYFIS